MGDIKGFLKVKRQSVGYRPICERIKDFCEVCVLPEEGHSQEQASRCMDCGTPFCHWGCPIGNYIPEWNDLVFRGHWEKAFQLLEATNNFPEITGRLCPALCEYSCVLGINDEAVSIRENELAIIEHAFRQRWVLPNPPKKRTGKKIAVIGSGPAGLSCADQLNQAGHLVVVFEKADKIGGILRYGIPDFKLEKWILDRRIEILKREGIVFNTGVYVGKGLEAEYLKEEFDAICLAAGCGVPRDLNIEGRGLLGIHFAMDYLIQANKKVNAELIPSDKLIDAKGKRVVVIGGGDTGANCVGVAHRQGAKCVVQIELLAKPPECRTCDYPWPKHPLLCKTSTSHEEGGIREWSVATKKFIGENGRVKKLLCQRLTQETAGREFDTFAASKLYPLGCAKLTPLSINPEDNPGLQAGESRRVEIEADLVILALGFSHPEHNGLVKDLGLELDAKGNIKTDKNYMTQVKGVFCAGDMRRGQSLIVWAIAEGRQAAYSIDKYLMGESCLPMI